MAIFKHHCLTSKLRKMKKIFNLLLPFIVTVSIFTTITYTACKQDNCKDITCKNGGSCNDGKCVCPDGYSGTRCEVVDPCKDVVCLNQGICESGKCNCPFEYEGDSCQYELRNKYAKTYEGTRRYAQDPPQTGWRLKFSKKGPDPTVMEVELLNLVGTVWQRYEIDLTSAGTFTIPQQVYKNMSIEGSGIISHTRVTIDMTIRNPLDPSVGYKEYFDMTAQ